MCEGFEKPSGPFKYGVLRTCPSNIALLQHARRRFVLEGTEPLALH